MDLISESNSGPRVLTARHISADKAFPEPNHALLNSTTLLCHTYSLQPDFGTYLAGLHVYAWVLWSCGLLLLAATCALYVVTLRAALRHWRECITQVAVVVAVYPLVAAATFLAILLPRARVLAEAIAQEAVMIAMYHFFMLVIMECGGIEQLVRSSAGLRLETRVTPCCCWPCCVLPRPKIRKQSLEWLRYLVLQLPVIQGLIYVITLVMWSEDMALYLRGFTFLQPFIAASILSGMWGVVMCVRAAESVGRRVRTRFLALQLALIILKLQCGITKLLTDNITFPCTLQLHPTVFINTINNCVILLEMLLLSLWAWRLYRVPPKKTTDKVQHVVIAVMDDSSRALEAKLDRDGVINKSFNMKACEL